MAQLLGGAAAYAGLPQPPPAAHCNGGGGTACGEDQGAAAGAAGGAHLPSRLPCLDASHPLDCSSCMPAPDEEEVPLFELVGDQGRKNGEKRLKSLLSKTRQWRSPEERAVAAAACDASGYENLARVLRNDVTSAALRKRDMIALARLWGYRSHIWRRRVTRGRGERRARTAAGTAPSQDMPGPPWLLEDVSPTALALALSDWDAGDLTVPPYGALPF